MLKTMALIAFILDALYFVYLFLKVFVEIEEIKKVNNAIFKKTEENIQQGKSGVEKAGVFIGVLLFSVSLIVLGLMPFIALTVKWIQEGFIVGLRYFLIYSLFWPLINAFRRTVQIKTIMNERQRFTIWMFLSGLFISIIYTIFGFDLNMFEVVSYYTNSSFMFSITLSIIIPSLLIFSIILSFYSIISKISLINIKNNHYPHWTIKYPFVLTILVASIFATLIYLSELSFENKLLINYSNMNDTINIIQNILTAALIPLIIGVFLNVNLEKKQKKEAEATNNDFDNSINKIDLKD